jgi:glycosyltransferase involved in cell wall biosynthesis
MRVLHVITGLGVGGAEHQLRLLLRRLPHECEVVTLTNPGPVADAIRADGTPVHVLGMRGNRDLTAVPRLARLMRAGCFDVVHTHLYRAGVYGRVAARLAGVPHVVATEHSLGDGLIEGRPTTRAVRALYLATERLGDTTIAVSGAVAGRLRAWGVGRDRIEVVPNGIDAAELAYDPALRAATRTRLGIPASARVVGTVGRLVPTKRTDVLVRALTGVPDATLLVVGDGPERAALERLTRESGLSSRVVFAGSSPYPRDLLCAMDVFAAPSTQETFGMAVLEALANGLPALYLTCPPLEELSPDAAPHARRLPPTPPGRPAELSFVDGLCTELARLDARGGARLPVPPAVAHYDIARLADVVGQVYEYVARGGRAVLPRPLASWRSDAPSSLLASLVSPDDAAPLPLAPSVSRYRLIESEGS